MGLDNILRRLSKPTKGVILILHYLHHYRSNDFANNLRFREQCRRITVKGAEFVYKITCIDLDPKMMASMPLYLKKDREIVDHYLATVGDRGLGCGPGSKWKG